ncbi:MAG: hypothetical protein M3552_18715 [Planctomycetota bacterium]|nr:hypothetical protein [Planctomycetota bacterium]
MSGTEWRQWTVNWCFGCNAETGHESQEVPQLTDGLTRRSHVCVECGIVTATTVEISEVEYNRLRATERSLEEARRSLRHVVNAVLAGEDLPAPFRRTEPATTV